MKKVESDRVTRLTDQEIAVVSHILWDCIIMYNNYIIMYDDYQKALNKHVFILYIINAKRSNCMKKP